MRLTSRGRYAVAALAELARHEGKGPIALRDVSQVQGISLSCLEPLFSLLRKYGLVESTRGPGGGYSLAKPSDSISIADIIRSINEDVFPEPTCDRSNTQAHSIMTDVWVMANSKALEFLDSVTLASVVPKEDDIKEAVTPRKAPSGGLKSRPERPALPSNVPNSVFAMGQFALN